MSLSDIDTSEVAIPPVTCDLEDIWAAWRDACEDLHLAHRAWRIAARDASMDAFCVLRAAADREAAAADVLQRHARASSVPPAGHEPRLTCGCGDT